MRNLFDQYSQPENRLTHALAVCLHEQRTLLRGFIAWVGVKAPVRVQDLLIVGSWRAMTPLLDALRGRN